LATVNNGFGEGIFVLVLEKRKQKEGNGGASFIKNE
jgi:hypothetical protein